MYISLDKHNDERIAAIDSNGNSITFGDIICYSLEWKKYIGKRCVCFILSNNSIGTLLGYLSCMINKIVPLVLDVDIKENLLSNLINLYHPSYLWIPQEKENRGLNCIWHSSEYKLLETGLSPYPIHEELSLLLTTSGSTGSPKLVRHTYNNLEAQARNISDFFEITEDVRALVSLPMYYTMGLSVINSHLYKGATILLTNASVLSSEFWKFISEQKVTSITGVPYNFEMMYRLKLHKRDFPYLKLLTQGGGKLSKIIQIAFAEYMSAQGGKYIVTYGQTEGTARMTYLPAEYAVSKCGSIGKAIPNGKVSIIDDDGTVITKAFQEGEMVYEGPNVTMGYAFCGDDLIKGDENFGKLYTGDIVYRDEEGFIFVVGRKNRFLKLFGHRVSLDECEQLIKAKYPIECACTGTDKLMKIYIVEEKYRTEVKEYVLNQTALYQNSVEVIVSECIPKNSAGKILYSQLQGI